MTPSPIPRNPSPQAIAADLIAKQLRDKVDALERALHQKRA